MLGSNGVEPLTIGYVFHQNIFDFYSLIEIYMSIFALSLMVIHLITRKKCTGLFKLKSDLGSKSLCQVSFLQLGLLVHTIFNA